MANRNNLKPIQRLGPFRKQPSADQLTRYGDIVIAAICLVIAAPLFLLVCIAIKFEAPGPAFEWRGCVGRRGRFEKLQFRTTVYDPQTLHTMRSRKLTAVGEVLRDTRIDACRRLSTSCEGK